MKLAVVLGLLFFAFAGSYGLNPQVIIDSSSPTPSWAHISGGEEITITGCGFSQYSEVVCIWNELWVSAVSVIQSDTLITCQTPELDPSVYDSVPMWVDLTLYWDGLKSGGTIVTENFRFGPAVTTITPTYGVLGGGTTVTLIGEGFSDFTGEQIDVYFDDVSSSGTTLGDTGIVVTSPAQDSAYTSSFFQNARVYVYFNNLTNWYLHVETPTFHYGPLFSQILPTCGGLVRGTGTFTIQGVGFSDQALSGNPTVLMNTQDDRDDPASVTCSIQGDTNIVCTAPIPEDGWVFDSEVVVLFKGQYNYAMKAGSYMYGPLVSAISPSVGYYGGGDTVTISGCGLGNYTGFNATVTFGSQTLTCPVSNQQIVCTTPQASSCGQTATVTVKLPCPNGNDASCGGSGPYTVSTNLQFKYGPFIVDDSVTPTRGAVAGGNTVTIFGSYLRFKSNEDWSSAVQCNFAGPGEDVTATVTDSTTTGQGKLVCTVPDYDWNSDSDVNAKFPAPCTLLAGSYHYGPICSVIAPTFGYISGVQTVAIQGVGFTDDSDSSLSNLRYFLNKVFFCVDSDGGDCPTDANNDHLASVQSTADTQISVKTPPVIYYNNGYGGNRRFGDIARVIITYNDTSNNNDYEIECPITYRYGPIVNAISTNKAPMGPRDTETLQNVQVSGVGYDDPWFTNQGVTVSHLVEFGADDSDVNAPHIMGNRTTSSGDTSATTATLWGGVSDTFNDVYMFFDTCNTTTTLTGVTVHWGPLMTNVTPVWGIKPNGTTLLTITGVGFGEFDATPNGDLARCIVDGQISSTTTIISDTQITCYAPENMFGTEAVVAVEFGITCLDEIPDVTKVVEVPNTINYRPTITQISPTFGKVSGGDTVTVTGSGFAGWGDYRCFFGNFEGTFTLSSDTQFTCVTPGNIVMDRRARFNTDVLVALQVHADQPDDEDGSQVRYSWKVDYASFHYGPLCTGVTPSRGYIMNPTVTVSGAGWDDDKTWTNVTFYWKVGTGSNVKLFQGEADDYSSGSSQELDVLNGTCTSTAVATIEFDNIGSITCPTFYYGPTVTDNAGNYNGNYGWGGNVITLVGSGFNDPTISYVQCDFGSGTTTFNGTINSDSNIACTVPPNSFDSYVAQVGIKFYWNTLSSMCELYGDFFHWGPVIQYITPTSGYVEGGGSQTVTVVGVGFDMEFLDQSKTNCSFGSPFNTMTSGTTAGSTAVTCTVPQNTKIGQVVQIGLKFMNDSANSPVFALTDGGGIIKGSRNLTLVTYYYGPIIDSISPTYGNLRGSISTGDQIVTVSGLNLDDPNFFENVTCVFTRATQTNTVYYTEPESASSTAVECPTPSWVSRCGDMDYVGLRWYISNTSLVPNPNPNNPYIINNNGNENFEYSYKAVITSVSPAPNADNQVRYDTKGLTINGVNTPLVLTGNFNDWAECSGGCNSHDKARCVFGQFLSPNDSTASNGDFSATTIKCHIPEGPFGYDGTISAILDPHYDQYTMVPPDVNQTKSWHWVPYVTSLTEDYVPADFEEVLTVVAIGGGFCNYDNVVCYFGSAAVQSDITDDMRVTCQAPPGTPSNVNVQLKLCGGVYDVNTDRCDCEYLGSNDIVPVSGAPVVPFTYVGFNTQISPSLGSTLGSTTVTLFGVGFSHYTNPRVFFDDNQATVVANGTTDTTIVVLTPDLVTQDNEYADRVSVITVVFDRDLPSVSWQNPYTFTVPACYDYGSPEVVSIEPSSLDLTDTDTTVTITGRYFNGGTNYFCRFGGIAESEVEGTLDDTTFDKIYCSAPLGELAALNSIGSYYVEVAIGDGTNKVYSTNTEVELTITQSPVIRSLTPSQGGQFGGTTVTILGDYFNGASISGVYYVRVLGQKGEMRIVGANQYVEAQTDGTTATTGSTVSTETTAATTASATTGNATASSTTATTDASTTDASTTDASTTDASTTDASTTTNSSTTTGGTTSKRSFLVASVPTARGVGDKIIFTTPPMINYGQAYIQVSLDGGLSWIPSTNTTANAFTFLEGGAVADDTGSQPDSTGFQQPSSTGQSLCESSASAVSRNLFVLAVLLLALFLAM